MLIQMIANQPQILGPVLKSTPIWVWGLLTALTWLGLSQARARTASLARVAFMPVAMTAFSAWGTISAFGNSPQFGYVVLAWVTTAVLAIAAIAPMSAPAGAQYDAAARAFSLPGSWIPMALILGIFLTKYVVGVETTMQPSLARDGQYTLIAGALYGMFSGIFSGRAVRLLKMAARPSAVNLMPQS